MRTAILIAALAVACLSCCYASFVKDWELVQPAVGSEKVSFYVALKQRNLDQLEELLYRVSDPRSEEYGRTATQQEIADLVYPPKEEHDRVYAFFAKDASTEIIDYGDSLKVIADVKVAANMFNAEFHWYHHVPSGKTALRAREVTVPAALKSDIHMITNLVSFPIIQKAKTPSKFPLGDTEFGYFAPATIRRIYNIPEGTQATAANSSQCAVEFLPEGEFSLPDFEKFCKLSDEKFYNYTHIVGPYEAGEDNTESNLDVQVLATVGSGAQNWFWTIEDGWIYEMALQIFNAQAKPNVLSISYGWPEILTCGSVTNAQCTGDDYTTYIERANAELAKLGSIRISVITCSQDEGAPSEANDGCFNTTHPIFGIYPGSSPYVTSVSATTAMPDKSAMPVDASSYPPICYQNPCSNSSLEYSCMANNTLDGWCTGGGFSEVTAAPSYQQAAIAAYFASKTPKPPTRYTWPKNRGYPDLSAIGARVLTVIGGQVQPVEGTSASTPIIAGITTLLNDARFNAGKSSLGFLNPMLYTMATDQPSAFKDITVGDNAYGCKYGYNCGVGWDPVTGLGTPNFEEMLAYVKTLP